MKFLLLCLILFAVACSKHYPAPVFDAKNKTTNSTTKTAQTPYKQKNYDPNYAAVKKGDSLYSIGFKHNLDYKYLAQINNIPAPYNIYPGQILRLKARKKLAHNTTMKTTPIIIKQLVSKPIIKPVVRPMPTVVKKSTVVKPTSQPLVQAPSANSRWIWPVTGKVISTFSNSDVSRKGIDITSPIGHPVFASNSGTVVYSGDGLLGYGELIIIKHDKNFLSAYAHNSSRLVKEGSKVKQGQQIAKSGKGSDGQGLLHFEIRLNGQPINPLKYLPK